jgi:farnesyl diphosphate synthase
MGLEYAQNQAKELQAQALESLAVFGSKADALRSLARLVVERTH